MPRILFVFTSASKDLKGEPTGWYLPEGMLDFPARVGDATPNPAATPAAHPYYILAPHVNIDFAAPAGPNPPVDPGSVQMFKDDGSVKFLEDETVKSKLSSAKKLSDVKVDDYDAIFYIGGHGPVLDLASDPVNIKLASSFWAANKITSAVCHGPAALAGATDPSGNYILAGRKSTAFSNFEEEQIKAVDTIPFLPEDKIKELGGKYEKAAEPWAPKVVIDGKLITGQNPASASAIGEALLNALRS